MSLDELAGVEYPTEKGYTPHDVRRALWYIVVAWLFGAPFFSVVSGAAFTSFLTRYLKADDFSYGLIMAAGPAAMVFLFLGSYVVERSGRTKRNFLLFVSAHRLIWLGVAAIPIWLTWLPLGVRLGIVGAIAFLSQALANYGGAGWSAWVSDIVPKEIAGKYFGRRAQLGMVSMMGVSTAVVYLLQQAHGQAWVYALVFAIASLLGTTDILLFIPVREVPRVQEEKAPTAREILVTPWRNRIFRGFALYTTLSWIAYMMMGPFTWRLCFDPVSKHGLGMSVLGAHLLLFIVPMAAMAWAAPHWGNAIDRFGPKPVLTASALMAIVAPGVWVFVHGGLVPLLWAAAIIQGLTWPGIDQVNFYMIVKGFPDARRTAYVAAFQFIMGVASMAGTALGGICAAFWQAHLHHLPGMPAWMSHYQPVFFTAIVLRLAAFVLFMPRLDLQGTAPLRQVARTLASDLSGGVAGRRLVRRRRPREMVSTEGQQRK